MEWNWYKNTNQPEAVLVVDCYQRPAAERIAITCLQGIVCGRAREQIYTMDSSQARADGEIGVLTILESMPVFADYGYRGIAFWELVAKYRQYVDEYIIYDGDNGDSVNAATSLTGLFGALPVIAEMESAAQAAGLRRLEAYGDASRMTPADVWAQFHAELNPAIIVEEHPENECLRDYAVAAKALVIYPALSERAAYLAQFRENSMIIGWGQLTGGSEQQFISQSGKHGMYYVAGDFARNLSVYSAFPARHVQVIPGDEAPVAQAARQAHYVTLIMSDGDNLQWHINRGNDKAWWGADNRARIPKGWMIPPVMREIAAPVWDYYVGSMSVNDNMTTGVSGAGFFFSEEYPERALAFQLAGLSGFMEDSGMNSVTVFGQQSFDTENVWDEYMKQPGIQALFYFDWKDVWTGKGCRKIRWIDGKPMFHFASAALSGVGGVSSADDVINEIREHLANNPCARDACCPQAYSVIYLQAWYKNPDSGRWCAAMQAAQEILDALEMEKVVFVTPDQMAAIAGKYHAHISEE